MSARPRRFAMSTRRLAVLLCTALTGTLLLTGLAGAASRLDQQQTTLDPNHAYIVGGSGPQVLGQTVTSGTAGLLTQVDLPVGCASGSNLVLEIRDAAGSPGSTVLASRTVSGLPGGQGWKSITLDTPPFITAAPTVAMAPSSPAFCALQDRPVAHAR